MPMTLAELLALFPDNTSGLIEPDDMRTVTTELYNSAVAGALLATKQYNPGTGAYPSTASTSYADVDATNLTVTFTVPASGQIIVVLTGEGDIGNNTALGWGLRSGGSNVTASQSQILYNANTFQINVHVSLRVLLTGLTPAASVTYTWSHARTTGSGLAATGMGGASGPALIEVWSA